LVRLPNAKTPDAQAAFRKICQLLPTLFSPAERIRIAASLYQTPIQTMVLGAHHGPGGATCNNRYCEGHAHGSEEFYEEFVEAVIGWVFLSANQPEQLKQQLIRLLKGYDHAVEARILPSELGEEHELLVQHEAEIRREQRHI
jgi:hypothetical protein